MEPTDRTESPPPATGDPVTTPGPVTPDRPRRSAGWRFGTPAVVLVCGALFVVSGTNSQGTDLRPGRYTSLASLTEGASRTYQDLQARADRLGAEVEQLTEQVDDAAVRKERRRAERLRGPAGLEPVTGEGVTIVMSDAPEEQIEEAVGRPDAQTDVDLMVVHQQDLQAVVNALWAGGAAAVTLQGQRLVTTTGIQCSGSQVQLQGVPYPEPYTIQAVGDPDDLVAALDADADVAGFRYDALRPEVGVGWDLTEDEVQAPAYDGLLDLEVAEPRTS